MNAPEVTREKLAADLRQVVHDAEELLKATAGQTGEKIHAARARVEESVKAARDKLVHAEQLVVEKGREAAKATDSWVHENPWTAAGIAAGVGLLIGLLLHRHRD